MKSLTTPSRMFQATQLKTWTQQLRHGHQRNQVNQRQLQPFFIMSPSDLLATQSSECLQERCPRHRHWETYENKTNLKQLTTCKQCYPASAFTQDTTQTQNWSQNPPFQDNSAPSCSTRHSPLLNSRLNSELRLHCAQMLTAWHPAEKRVNLEPVKALQREKIPDYSLALARSNSGCLQITWQSTISMDTLVYNHWYFWALRILMAHTRLCRWTDCAALLVTRTVWCPLLRLVLGMLDFWCTSHQGSQGTSLEAPLPWQGCSLRMWQPAVPVAAVPWAVP